MLGNHGRSVATVVFTPFAKLLARIGITPNMVTYGSAVIVAAQPFSTHLSDAAIMPRLIYECLRDDSDDRECVSDLKRASRFCEATYTRFQS